MHIAVRHYKRYDVWRVAHDLVLETYRVTDVLPKHEKYGLTSQMRRASVSIASNIAEGAGRGTDADFSRFLLMANGSANELESQVLVARDLTYLSRPTADGLIERVEGLRRRLTRLIQSLN
jgi:four helix bundle protein